jgi:hypothetical protein
MRAGGTSTRIIQTAMGTRIANSRSSLTLLWTGMTPLSSGTKPADGTKSGEQPEQTMSAQTPAPLHTDRTIASRPPRPRCRERQ